MVHPIDIMDCFYVPEIKTIAEYFGIEYQRGILRNDLIDLIREEIFPDDGVNKRRIKKILRIFNKGRLQDICRYKEFTGFSKYNYDELVNFIAEEFLNIEDIEEEYQEEIEEEDAWDFYDDLFEEEYVEEQLLDQEDEIEENFVDRIKILLIGAQPQKTDDISLNYELEQLEDIIEGRPFLKLIPKYNATTVSFTKWLLRHNPHILHISAHGNKGVIIFEDLDGKPTSVQIEKIASIIEAHNKRLSKKPNSRLFGIILSSCFSYSESMKIADKVQFVIAMTKSIQVESSIDFAKGFYIALAEGNSIKDAFDMGIAHIEDGEEQNIPKLLPEDRNLSKAYVIKREE